jgi:hypothetical protein
VSKPANGAARNTMSEFERKCYDWGWEDSEQRIIKLLEEFDDSNLWREVSFDSYEGFNVRELIDLIKGEQK